jgi:hypothetical protein
MDKGMRAEPARLIAGRIQQIISEGGRTPSAFYRDLERTGHAALVSTVRGWLPPPSKWEWIAGDEEWWPRKNPVTGKRLSKSEQTLDWKEVKLPRADGLLRFCDITRTRADFILFGTGQPFRGETMEQNELGLELAAALKRQLVKKGVALPSGYFGYSINPEALIDQAAESVREEFEGWQAYRAKVLPLRAAIAALPREKRRHLVDWIRTHSPQKEFLDTWEPEFDDSKEKTQRRGFIDWE